jgi:hypothetical protein
MRPKFVVSIVFSLGCLCIMLPSSLRADTIYTYTGAPDAYCSGTYASVCPDVALSITIDMSSTCVSCAAPFGVDNESLPDITSFSVTDGTGLDITNLTGSIKFGATTNATGAITSFWVYAESGPPTDTFYQAGAYSTAEANIPYSYSYDYSTTFMDQNPETGLYAISGLGASILPGTWTETTTPGTGTFTITAPEPSSFVLLLAGIAFVVMVRKGPRRPVACAHIPRGL